MSNSKSFDYIIIGNGLAGLQLALALSEDSFFNNKQIALIDSSEKKSNDKTWSFWEKKTGKWDSIVDKRWSKALFFSSRTKRSLNLEPYTYKTIHSINFYDHAKQRLSQKSNFHFIVDTVVSVEQSNQSTVKTKTNRYTAHHIFDSRISDDFLTSPQKYINVIQHFKGYIIETKTAKFNPDEFTMMDYRMKDGKQTTFTYVLPFSETKALVEFTYFTSEVVNESVYDAFIEKYITETLQITNYKILDTESGKIPMTSFPFHKYSTNHVTKIGTAGGWVKGSTGYSFKNSEKKVAKIITNLKQNKTPSEGLFKKRFLFYDKIFLKVLHDENSKGEWIFEQFYAKNSVSSMLRFLDEESSFIEELKIMKSLFSMSFIKAFFKTL